MKETDKNNRFYSTFVKYCKSSYVLNILLNH